MPYSSRPGGTLYADAVSAVTEIITQTPSPTAADVARHIGADEQAVAKVFPQDQDLMAAVLENAIILLHDRCVKSVVKADANDPLAQFMAFADAYIEWAHDHPQEFAILGNIPAELTPPGGTLLRYEIALHQQMMRMLTLAQQMGQLEQDADLPLLIATARSFAYGVAGKMLSGNLSRWTDGTPPLAAARAALHMFSRKVIRG